MNLYLRKFMGILFALLIFCGIYTTLNYMYVSRNYAEDQARLIWHYYYENAGKINNLYLGSSHVYCGVNAVYLDELNGQYNFNLASSTQQMNGSYYLLKEADRDNSLSHVYLELYYRCHATEQSKPESIVMHYRDNWLNTDYMKNSLNKWEYMLSTCNSEKYIDMWFPFVRYRINLGNWEFVKQTIEEKKQDNYRAYQWGLEEEYESFVQQGYMYSERTISDIEKLYPQKIILEETPIGEIGEGYLKRIIEYCQERNILITVFIVPVSELELISTENYDYYINQVREITEKYDIAFYDFNLAKAEYLPIQNNIYFRDSEHLNDAGATLFTDFFDKVSSGNMKENKKYFYDSYVEKLSAASPAIYGLYYKDIGQDRIFHIASNRQDGMEYKVTLRRGGAKEMVVQNFMDEQEFVRPIEEHGVCTIEVRMKNELDILQALEIEY